MHIDVISIRIPVIVFGPMLHKHRRISFVYFIAKAHTERASDTIVWIVNVFNSKL